MTIAAMLYNVNRDPKNTPPITAHKMIPHAVWRKPVDKTDPAYRTPEQLQADYALLVTQMAQGKKK